MGSCKLCPPPRPAPFPVVPPVNLFAYTFCKITLCGLHPRPTLPALVLQRTARRDSEPSTTSLLSPGGKLPCKFHRGSLMYAELYERNSKFGMAVLGAFTMSIFSRPLSLSASARRGRTADETRLQERRTRVILIRTRPRGVEVKAGFLLGVSRRRDAPRRSAR